MSESKKHQVFRPNAIQAQGDTSTGNLNVYYRMQNEETIAVVLSPDLMEKTVRHIALAIGSSPVPETKAVGHVFAVREISAHIHKAATLTLRYETEAGLSVEATIDRADAEQLKEQLVAALDAQQASGSQAKH